MQYKYTYRNKKTGARRQTNERLNEKEWELTMEKRNGMIKQNKVIRK